MIYSELNIRLTNHCKENQSLKASKATLKANNDKVKPDKKALKADLVAFTKLLGEVRLKYHLTDKAYLLPPYMRTIARFMNMSSWVDWGQHMLHAYSILPKEK